MGLKLVLGHHKQDDEPHRRVVQRVELDPLGGPPESGHDLSDSVRRGVGDGDAEPDPGTHGFLALAQRSKHHVPVLGLDLTSFHQQIHEFHDGGPSLHGLHLGDDLID